MLYCDIHHFLSIPNQINDQRLHHCPRDCIGYIAYTITSSVSGFWRFAGRSLPWGAWPGVRGTGLTDLK